MNQKMMMQLLYNKESEGTHQSSIHGGSQTYHVTSKMEGSDSGYPHGPAHVKSKSFMPQDLVSGIQDLSQVNFNAQSQKQGSQGIIKQKAVKGHIKISDQQMMMNNIIKTQQSKIKQQKPNVQQLRPENAPAFEQPRQSNSGKTKPVIPTSWKSKAISSSFDKTSAGNNKAVTAAPNSKQQTLKASKTKKPSVVMGAQTFSQAPSTQGQNLYIQPQMNQKQSTQGGIVSSVSNLHQPQKVQVQVVAPGHQRTKSDANYIQNLKNKSKTNFVISSSNHVYQSKKATNLKQMNNNNQISSQGATKGLLSKQMNEDVSSQYNDQANNGSVSRESHKKNQYSTNIKSNYKNLVGSMDKDYINKHKVTNIDVDVFQSNQNKTTEQKYVELKMKYNDLLNKHLFLAAQQTEDNRAYFGGKNQKTNVSAGPKSPNQSAYQQAVSQLKFPGEDMKSGNQYKPMTQVQTLDHSKITIQENIQSQGYSGYNEGALERQTNYDDHNLAITFFEENQEAIEAELNNLIQSHQESLNQTPRTSQGPVAKRHTGSIYISQEQNGSNNISSSNLPQEFRQSINGSNIVSRMEAQKPIDGQSLPNQNALISETKYNQIIKPKGKMTHSGISHKRSVSDGVFNVINAKSQLNQQQQQFQQIPQSTQIQNYHQQIPLKQKSKQMSFDQKINQIRQTNQLSIHQQMLGPQSNNMAIIGDNDQITEEQEILEITEEENGNTFSHEENLITEFGQEYPQNYHQINKPQSQNISQTAYRQTSVRVNDRYKKSEQTHASPKIMEAYQDPKQNMLKNNKAVTANTIQSENSERKLLTKGAFNHGNQSNGTKSDQANVKKKKTKSLLSSLNLGSYQVGAIQHGNKITDIDMNVLAKKYKQMRKSGEYTAGLSTDAKYKITPNTKPVIKTQENNRKSSVQRHNASHGDKFEEQIFIQQNNFEGNIKVQGQHRRIKSGVSDKTNGSKKNPQIIQKQTAQPMQHMQNPAFLFHNDSSGPSSAQRSLKSFKNRPEKDASNFMLIYEENQNQSSEFYQNMDGEHPDSHVQEVYNSGTPHDNYSGQKKVISVSFNDFNQSIDQEHSRENSQKHIQPHSNIQQIAQTNSSNSNLNHFLEALQKIKPQNPIVSHVSQNHSGSKQSQKALVKSQSPVGAQQSNNKRVKKFNNRSEIPSASIEQARHEKYQKMMHKVGNKVENDHYDVQSKHVVGGHHQRIKSTHEVTEMVILEKPSARQTVHHSKERKNMELHGDKVTPQGAHKGAGVQFGIPADSQQSSQKNLKITFVADEKLMKQHKLKQQKQIQSKKKEPIGVQKNAQIMQLNSNQANFLNTASGSNTGGQPSPILSSKRVPQKILAQGGDGSMSPPTYNSHIHENNFILEKDNSIEENKGAYNPFHNIIEQQVISDFEESQSLSPLEKSNQQLIHNLNKKMNANMYIESDSFGKEEWNSVRRDKNLSKSKNESTGQQKKVPQIKPEPHVEPFSLANPVAPQVSERLITEESNNGKAGGDTPRSKQIRKLLKLIKLSFRQQGVPPVTTIDFYRIGKILGKGAFGKVNLAVHKLTECLCAVKSLNKQYFSDENQSKKVMQEVLMLKKTRHKNIVRLYEYFETEKHIVFVIEICAGGDLLNYVRRRRRLKEDVAKCLFKQIIESLAYCHSKNILHRDIKLDNILLDANGRVKICDFGVGKIVKKGEKMTEQCGTPAYIAPEILRDKGYYGFAVDIWSAGVVLYAMLYGTVPFKATNMTELQKLILKAKYTLKEDISPESRELLKGLMEKDPAKRLTIAQILEHPWLADAEDTENIDMFTDQEKQYIKTEYTYTGSKRYNRNFENTGMGMPPIESDLNCSGLDKDQFTEHMLDSTQNSILKNAETKSVILAPFNSTKSNLQMNPDGTHAPIELSDSIKELIEDRRIIKFGARVRDIDRQYEINNNADLDNGVYHNYEDDEEDKGEENPTDLSENNKSPEPDAPAEADQPGEVALDEEEQEILKELKMQGQKKKEEKKKQSELQKLENMIQNEEKKDLIDQKHLLLENEVPGGGGNVVTENSVHQNTEESLDHDQYMSPQSNSNHIKIIEGTEEVYTQNSPQSVILKKLYEQQQLEEEITVDDYIISQVEVFGFPRDYILKGMKNKELNYATTGCLLLHFQKQNRERMLRDEQILREKQLEEEKE